MMRNKKADPPSTVGGLEGIDKRVGSWGKKKKKRKKESKAHGLRSMGHFWYLVTLLLLAHEYAAGVSWIAAVEGEQQIQSWEVKDINLRATAWASAGKNVCNAISVAIVDANTNAAGKVFCVGHELGK